MADSKSAYKLGSLFIKPAVNFIFGGDEETTTYKIIPPSAKNQQKQSKIETTTSYNSANFAYSPGYYLDSLIKCPSDVLHGQTITFTCKREQFVVSCDDHLFAHDTVHIDCKSGYEYLHGSELKTKIECMPSGKWSSPIYECVPSCGKVTKKAAALIIHGKDTEVSEFPWNVAIYFTNVLICGGSIISERVVLSAGGSKSARKPFKLRLLIKISVF